MLTPQRPHLEKPQRVKGIDRKTVARRVFFAAFRFLTPAGRARAFGQDGSGAGAIGGVFPRLRQR
jgi:hypothetical protein